MVLNSLSFSLSIKLLISPTNQNESPAGTVFLIVCFSLLSFWVYHATSLAYRVSAEKSANNLMEILLYDICCFSLVECNIFFLSIIFVSWFFCVLAWFFLFFSCMGFSAILWLEWVFHFPQYEVFCYYLFNIFSFLFRTNIMWISISLILSQSSLRLLQFCLIIFLLLFPPTHSFFLYSLLQQ